MSNSKINTALTLSIINSAWLLGITYWLAKKVNPLRDKIEDLDEVIELCNNATEKADNFSCTIEDLNNQIQEIQLLTDIGNSCNGDNDINKKLDKLTEQLLLIMEAMNNNDIKVKNVMVQKKTKIRTKGKKHKSDPLDDLKFLKKK